MDSVEFAQRGGPGRKSTGSGLGRVKIGIGDGRKTPGAALVGSAILAVRNAKKTMTMANIMPKTYLKPCVWGWNGGKSIG